MQNLKITKLLKKFTFIQVVVNQSNFVIHFIVLLPINCGSIEIICDKNNFFMNFSIPEKRLKVVNLKQSNFIYFH